MSFLSHKLFVDQLKRLLMLLFVIIVMMLLSVVLASIWSNTSYLHWKNMFNLGNSTRLIGGSELNNSLVDLKMANKSNFYETLINAVEKPNFYYEEQMPVVVYSKSDINDDILAETDQGDVEQEASSEEKSFNGDFSEETYPEDESNQSNWPELADYNDIEGEKEAGRQLANSKINAVNITTGLPNLALKTILGLIGIFWHAILTFQKVWSFSLLSPLLGLTALKQQQVQPRQYQEMFWENLTEHTNRSKRSETSENATNAVSRYIKGDPLQGYYDFVITEGSYKFWAVFQVGTALLIIYSTFAAIYYSKVNPLVSDYEYVDYLGGGRSLSAPDLDFIDLDADKMDQSSNNQNSQSHRKTTDSWLNWFLERISYYGRMFQKIAHKVDSNLKQLHHQTTIIPNT